MPRPLTIEKIDSFDHPLDDIKATFEDIRRINRFLGGRAVMMAHLPRLITNCSQPVKILDIGTGSADLPCTLFEWARKHNVSIKITATDANETVLQLAETQSANYPEIIVEKAVLPCLKYEDNAFEIVMSNMTFHHFEMPFAVQSLQEMYRVSKKCVFINDLRRGFIPAGLIWLITRLTHMHKLTQHDAPLSVQKGFTLHELEEMAKLAGFSNFEIFKQVFWRAVLIVEKSL